MLMDSRFSGFVPDDRKEAKVAIARDTVSGRVNRPRRLWALLTLAVLIQPAAASASAVPPETAVAPASKDAAEQFIARAVEERRLTVSFDHTPLYQVLREIKSCLCDDINIVIDNQALEEAGISPDHP